ncbi:hypothetical protein Syun_001007 [Stephania yunnanensis]|uniref:SWIM-type domain-containing protein n=1 Tax=Stephania yunnanensis TaxID=152371 RepID=A0AAP0LCW8_9MAGN
MDEGGDRPTFTKFYVCFEACKKGWLEGCRKIVGLDGCFMKGLCKGQLLCAIGRDGNNQMFPIVQVENTTTWTWFIRCIQRDIQLGDGAGITIMSDMQKGLECAIQLVLPEAERRRCARHVYANWAKKWRGEERKIAFWNCARATTVPELKDKMRALADLGNGYAEKDAMGYEVEKWSKAYFNEKVNCDVVDNNLAETFNGWILEARCKSIISMLEDIRRKVMKRLVKKKQESTKWHCDVSPRVLSKLEKNKEKSFDWMAEWNGYNEYEVSSVYNGVDKHKVDMKARTCSCREWNLTGIPCPHSICTIYHQSKTP